MKKYIYYIKRSIKYLIAYSLYYTGILLLLKKIKLDGRVIILTYHRILPYRLRDQSFSHSAIMVDPENFDRQLSFIKRHFNVIEADSVIRMFDNKFQPASGSCLITFDDGWEDNYVYALPVLKKYSVNALVFTATDYIGSNKLFWQEAIGHGIKQLVDLDTHDSREFLKTHNLSHVTSMNYDNQIDIIRDYVRDLKTLPYKEIDKILDNIIAILGTINYGNIDRYLNENQIKEMHNNGICFGSHACSHKILTRLDDQSVLNELSKSKQCLQDIISDEVHTLAYPNGNYTNHLGELAESVGYRIAFGTQHGIASSSDDKFNIKRININDTTASNSPIMLSTVLGIF